MQAQAAFSDEDWADHLREFHGFGDSDITHMYYQHGRLDDPHQAIHDAGLADHDHLPAGNEELERQLDDRFGPQMPIPARPWQQSPGLGGRVPGDPHHTMDVMHGLQARPLPDPDSPARLLLAVGRSAEQDDRRPGRCPAGEGLPARRPAPGFMTKASARTAPRASRPGRSTGTTGTAGTPTTSPKGSGERCKKREKRAKKGEDPEPAIGFRGPGDPGRIVTGTTGGSSAAEHWFGARLHG